MNLSHLRNILIELPEMSSLAQPLDSHPDSGIGYKNKQEITYLDMALMDLMGRYGVIDDRLVGTIKQSSQMGDYQQDEIQVSERIGPELELSLKLERAKEIRSMDIGRGADVFCAIFVDEGSEQGMISFRGGSGSLGAGGRLFQTEVMRGNSEADWTWNQVVTHELLCCIVKTSAFVAHVHHCLLFPAASIAFMYIC